jgi:transcriptional regulator with XRE-family HTH domain
MIADSIKLARRKAGLSLRGLAEAMNGRVTAQAIGKYERNEDIPSSGVLISLAKTLGVSIAYLMDTQGVVLSGVEFRTKASTTAADRAVVETEVLEWIERYLQIEHVLELESSAWQCPIAPLRRLNEAADAEALATEVRKKWNLGIDPTTNMTELLEEKGLHRLRKKAHLPLDFAFR